MEFKKRTSTATPAQHLPQRTVAISPVTPVVQRQAVIQRQLQQHTQRPVQVQRQVAQPIMRAAELHTQEAQRLAVQRETVQREAAALGSVSPAAVTQALQRQQTPAPQIPTKPQSTGDWVTVMRFQAEQAQGRRMNSRESMQYTALQRQVASTIAQNFRQDQQPAIQRYEQYGQHLASLQQSAAAPVASVALHLMPAGERPAVQRAVDEALQREAEQRAQDTQALKFHSLQRQMAELDHEASQPVMQRIQARRGSGNPLPEAVQRHLEQGLNHDLSSVRIHDDAEADKLAKKVNAVAFTTGQDIYFRAGKFNPNSQSGLELLAHEVTHAVQQSRGQVGKGVDPDSGLEAEARAMGRKLASITPKSLIPPVSHRDGLYAPGRYTQKAALQRVQQGAVAATILKPFAALQRQPDITVQRAGLFDSITNRGKEAVASGLTVIPGYKELCAVFGKDLVTGKTMQANPSAILDALAKFIPAPFRNVIQYLRETKAIEKALAWFKAELGKLNIGQLLPEIGQALKSLNIGKAKSSVTARISQMQKIVAGSGRRLAEIALEAAGAGFGPAAQQVIAGLRQGGDIIMQVLKNPAGFARNLMAAAKGGFTGFRDRAKTHLQNGVGKWLGGVTGGMPFPTDLDVMGVFSTVLTVLGITHKLHLA